MGVKHSYPHGLDFSPQPSGRDLRLVRECEAHDQSVQAIDSEVAGEIWFRCGAGALGGVSVGTVRPGDRVAVAGR
jgi:hypothetical protein